MNNYNKQLELEQSQRDRAYERVSKKLSDVNSIDTSLAGLTLTKLALRPLAAALETLWIEKRLKGERKRVLLFLEEHYKENELLLAYLIVKSALHKVADKKRKETLVATSIAKAVAEDIQIRTFESNKETAKLANWIKKEYKSEPVFKKRATISACKIHNVGLNLDDSLSKAKIGLVLVKVLTEAVPELFYLEKKMGINSYKEIAITPQAEAIILKQNDTQLMLEPIFEPLICEPQSWRNGDIHGGYLLGGRRIPFVRVHDKEHAQFIKNQDLTPIMNHINEIQKTAWQINKEVLQVMDYVYNNNLVAPEAPGIRVSHPKTYGGLPTSHVYLLDELVHKHTFGALDSEGQFVNKEDLQNYRNSKRDARNWTLAQTSKRLSLVTMLSIAKRYKEYPSMFFSYTVDFRGRVYPVQQTLTPQGTSESKALLTFRDTKELGATGLYWLKVHMANCFGLDKEVFEKRIQWVEDNHAAIIAWAESPLDYLRYWSEADDAWLFLAAIFEYRNAYKLANPMEYRSNLPINIDATCSGIQIYSALLRDREGAEAVNVIGTKRNDIYQKVADKVNARLESGGLVTKFTRNTADGESEEVDISNEVRSLKGNISRKLTKRNTMTIPYSVTKQGMRDQLIEEFEALEEDNKKFWYGNAFNVAKILADLNEEAIYDTVKGARLVQDYLKETAGKFKDKPMIWTTPAGMPVYQAKPNYKKISVKLGGGQQFQLRESRPGTVNVGKHRSGIAPNYIHSLDSAILLLTIDKCVNKYGMSDFSLIHDSFGTHACNVDKLGVAIRETFIEIFSVNQLSLWGQEVTKGNTEDFIEVPKVDDTFDIEDIRTSKYIFS